MMRYLYLIRHAKASSEYLRIDDFDRPLKTKGVLQANQMAEKLLSKGIKPDLILSSTAARALHTAQIFAKKYQIDYSAIRMDASIYESNVEKMLEAIAKMDSSATHLFVVGHNPSISQLANYLLDSFMPEMPICGVVCISVEIDHWKDLQQHKHQLLYFDLPDKIDETIIEPAKDQAPIAPKPAPNLSEETPDNNAAQV